SRLTTALVHSGEYCASPPPAGGNAKIDTANRGGGASGSLPISPPGPPATAWGGAAELWTPAGGGPGVMIGSFSGGLLQPHAAATSAKPRMGRSARNARGSAKIVMTPRLSLTARVRSARGRGARLWRRT